VRPRYPGVHGAGGSPRQAQVYGVFRCMISSLDLIDGRGPGFSRPRAAKFLGLFFPLKTYYICVYICIHIYVYTRSLSLSLSLLLEDEFHRATEEKEKEEGTA
jgi:hypothetical protein